MPVLATAEREVASRSRDMPEAGKAAQNNGPKDSITCRNERECEIFFSKEDARKQDVGLEKKVDRERRQNGDYTAMGNEKKL